jgi:hypothetical protein
MKPHCRVAVQHREYRPTTDSGHSFPVAPSLLDRKFRVAKPDSAQLGSPARGADRFRSRRSAFISLPRPGALA